MCHAYALVLCKTIPSKTRQALDLAQRTEFMSCLLLVDPRLYYVSIFETQRRVPNNHSVLSQQPPKYHL